MARLSRHLWGGTSLKTAAKEANKKGNEKTNSTQLQKIDERSIVTVRVTS